MLKRYVEIAEIRAREIIDSRGMPTIEVDVLVSDEGGQAYCGMASAPSDAELCTPDEAELRDGGEHWNGFGIEKAAEGVNGEAADELCGMNALDQVKVDLTLSELDKAGTKLGRNAVFAVSVAVAKAAAAALRLPLFQHLGGVGARELPVPLVSLMSGCPGSEFRELMLVPMSAATFREALRLCTEVYQGLSGVLANQGLAAVTCGDGAFISSFSTTSEAIEAALRAIEAAGYGVEHDFMLALGRPNGITHMNPPPAEEIAALYESLAKTYPIISVESGFGESNWDGWRYITERLGDNIQVAGGCLWASDEMRLMRGVGAAGAGAVIIKPGEAGTVTGVLDAIRHAQRRGIAVVISRRAGETEDTALADICVAAGAGQFKGGAPTRSDRAAKYNQLLRIEEALGNTAMYVGAGAFARPRGMYPKDA